MQQAIMILLRQLWKDELGLATVEYALLLSGLIVGLCATWHPLGEAVAGAVGDTTEVLTPPGQGGLACE